MQLLLEISENLENPSLGHNPAARLAPWDVCSTVQIKLNFIYKAPVIHQ